MQPEGTVEASEFATVAGAEHAAAGFRSPAARPVPIAEHAPEAITPPKLEDEPAPAFAMGSVATSASSGWAEERLVAAGVVLLAFLADLIIFIASFFDTA